MARRLEAVRDPVTLELDGEAVVAERGEPIAFALLAADKLALARSPKLHRPRGPSCLRGGCDGCLCRVDGEPNVMTCMAPARGGERVETQNVLGSRETDLLRVTDWFFPHGMDHHRLFAGIPGLSQVMLKLARRVGGLGLLPDAATEVEPAERRPVDVLVVGAGAAGLTVAERLARAGRQVLVVDDAPSPGGSLRARAPELARELLDAARGAQILRATAAGVYEGEVLLATRRKAILATPRALVVATGAHDGVALFAGNDVPGVVSARAASLLLASGVAIGDRVALLGRGPYARAFQERAGDRVSIVVVPDGASIAIRGATRVRSIEVEGGPKQKVDAVLVDVPGAPAFELAEQSGARVRFAPELGGYVPECGDDGRVAAATWCAGEAAGTGSSLAAIVAQAARVADAVLGA